MAGSQGSGSLDSGVTARDGNFPHMDAGKGRTSIRIGNFKQYRSTST